MTLLSANLITKYFSDNLIISDTSFQVTEKEHIGLVGVNGCGKTTLFRILTGTESYDNGNFFINKCASIGYMEQFSLDGSEKTAYEEVLRVFSDLSQMEEELEQLHKEIEKNCGGISQLIEHQHELQEKYQNRGGLTYKSRARSALLGLGFSETEINQSTKTLSGGQKAKVQLAKLLLSGANLLLLDEPTNHLDISSVEWLEDYLKNFAGAYIIISHDRYFLDNVTTKTFELENHKLTVYNGNYSHYTVKKKENSEIQRHHYENTMNEIHRIEGIVSQQRQWNRERNIKTAESKLKQIARLRETLVTPESSPDELRFKFSIKNTGGNDVLSTDRLTLKYGNREIFNNVNIQVKRGERIFLIGPNGCGKTSLFKILTSQQPGTAGMFYLGAQVDTGYYDQTQSGLTASNTVLSEVWNTYPKMTETAVRNALASFLFKGDEVFKIISALSGGEKARVAILKLMLSQANFLLLDEPTNHLDIFSREALEAALRDYEGTLFMVSHDRYFINKMADRIYAMENGTVTEYTGNYDYYLDQKKNNGLSASRVPVPENPKSQKPNEYKLKKEREAAERKRLSAIKRTEAAITEKEAEIGALQEKLNSPEAGVDYQLIISLSKELDDRQAELDNLFAQWEKLETKN